MTVSGLKKKKSFKLSHPLVLTKFNLFNFFVIVRNMARPHLARQVLIKQIPSAHIEAAQGLQSSMWFHSDKIFRVYPGVMPFHIHYLPVKGNQEVTSEVQENKQLK